MSEPHVCFCGPCSTRVSELEAELNHSLSVLVMEELRIQRNKALDRITQLETAIAAQPHIKQQVFCRWADRWYVREVKDCTSDNCVWTAIRERVEV